MLTTRLRIAHFVDTQNKGGAEVMLIDLCKYQKQIGHDVVVFQHDNAFIVNACSDNQITCYDIPNYTSYKSTIMLPFYSISMAKVLKKVKIDVLHSHLFGPITGNALASKINANLHVGTLHDIYMIEEKPARIRLLQLARLLDTRLICVSRHMTNFYAERMDLSTTAIDTIYNATTAPVPPDDRQKQALRAMYRLAETDVIVAVVGRLVELKRIDRVIRALSTIESARIKFLVIGDGPELDALKSLASSLKLDNQVIFTGEIANVRDLLHLADIFTQYSTTEGLSMSIIEAMSCGLPSVVSDVGGNSELVDDGVSGYVIESESDNALAECLRRLINDGNLRAQFGTQAYSRFNQYFSNDQFQNAYLELYRNNLKRR